MKPEDKEELFERLLNRWNDELAESGTKVLPSQTSLEELLEVFDIELEEV